MLWSANEGSGNFQVNSLMDSLIGSQQFVPDVYRCSSLSLSALLSLVSRAAKHDCLMKDEILNTYGHTVIAIGLNLNTPALSQPHHPPSLITPAQTPSAAACATLHLAISLQFHLPPLHPSDLLVAD